MAIEVEYMYRDAANYKQSAVAVFDGDLTDAERRQIRESLDSGEYFLAGQVGLSELWARWSSSYDDDHIWHELVEIRDSSAAPTETVPASAFAAQFNGIVWDEQAAGARLDAWRETVPRR